VQEIFQHDDIGYEQTTARSHFT